MNISTNKMKYEIIFSILSFASLIFLPISLFFNSFNAFFTSADLMSIGFNLVCLGISFLLSAVITIIKYKLKKPLCKKLLPIYVISCFYSLIFIIVNVSTLLFKDIWNIYTIYILLALSIVVSLILLYLPLKNYLVRSLIYYIVIAIPYFIITLVFGNYGDDNSEIIVFFVYTIAYTVARIIAFIILKSNNNIENNKKEYSKMFK